jgi:hypothetical protein
MNTSTTTAGKVRFTLQNLEITQSALVIRLFDEKTIIPLKEIASYDLKWHLHDPIFANKCWFLVLKTDLQNGEEQSWTVAEVKFSYVNDEYQLRQRIESKITNAIDLAISRRNAAQLRKK